MNLVELNCDGFRSLSGLCFKPAPGVNIIRGHNAQGKTSLLEALLFAATSKSHRTSQETDLVQHGAREFHVAARVQRSDREVAIEVNWWQGVKRVRVNGLALSRVSDLLGKINVVFFSQEDVGLVRGSAAQRRRFLDMELSQLMPGYLHALQQYRQVVRQRNELLRGGRRPDPDLLGAWDEQLGTHGSVLMEERRRFVESLAGPAQEAYGQVAQGERLQVAYRPDLRDGVPFTEVLAASRDSDIRQGMTTRGPHRDDLEFLVDGEPARHFASQGQQRTAVLALKLAELELVRDRAGEYPILMLDDVLSELDTKRSRRLFSVVRCGAQCLMTTTDLGSQDALFGAECVYFLIRNGQLVRQ
ncbi:MAG: DNA replication/repair protein RecF [Candidatus Hydrogenedentes bacterium]|nr:DNA replication/repair protein RecF [Candidatus Hydrogenedentota bacterium]